MNYRARILEVMLWIDSHLDQPIRLTHLGQVACLSPFHFHRIFAAYTGESLYQYVQRSRLELAANMLLDDPCCRIVDVAMCVGFETHQAFTRAFRKISGRTPSEYRFTEQANRFNRRTFHTKLHNNHQIGGKLRVSPRIVRLKPQKVVFAKLYGMQKGNIIKSAKTAAHNMAHHFEALGADGGNSINWLSMFPASPVGLNDVKFPIRFGAIIDNTLELTEKFDTTIIGPGRYAVFRHNGPHEYLFQTWNLALFGWMARSRYHSRNKPPFEIYLNNPQTVSPENLNTDIYLPID